MIFPTDYRERLLKEQKSRQYRAMLDEQIRDNYLLSQQRSRKNNRIRTDPAEIYDYRSRIHSSSRQIPHQSTYLPSINNSNVIDHGYRYGQTPTYQHKKYGSQVPSRKQTIQRHNDQDLDNHLNRCLEECDHLINGINKNFINLNNHLRASQGIRNGMEIKRKPKTRNNSKFDLFKDPDYKNNRSFDSYPLTNLRGSELMGYDDDIGRNQMMNYNILKSKEKFQYFSPQKKYNSPSTNRDQFDNSFDRSQQKSKRKHPNDLSNSKTKNSPFGQSQQYDTINSYDQNEFTNTNIDQGKSSQMSAKKRKEDEIKKMKQDEAVLQQMKKKDDHIIEHLRKAKNRGNILFKKIEVFKKQREQMERSLSSMADNYDDSPKKTPKNSQNKGYESKNSNYQNENKNVKESTKNIESTIKKQDISINSNPKKQEPTLNSNQKKQEISINPNQKKQDIPNNNQKKQEPKGLFDSKEKQVESKATHKHT